MTQYTINNEDAYKIYMALNKCVCILHNNKAKAEQMNDLRRLRDLFAEGTKEVLK